MSEPEAGGDKMEAVEMLTHGQGLAFQLRDLLLDDQIPVSGDRLVRAEDLLGKIHGSFTDLISALDRHSPDDKMNHGESGESSRSRTSSSLPKATAASRRKRRQISEGESWTTITSNRVHDGHAWRKYGQKSILNSNHSRDYFKCTHKDQLGCPAKKHVQQTGDDPVSYTSVYTYRHTCTMLSNTMLHAPAAQMTLESAAAQQDMNLTSSSSSFVLNFQSSLHDSDHNNFNNNALMKQEYTALNDQAEAHHTSVQQLTSGNSNFLGSSSDVGRQVPHASTTLCAPSMGMGDLVTYSFDHSAPYISYSEDTEDPWFDYKNVL